jgi:hypothetical protein
MPNSHWKLREIQAVDVVIDSYLKEAAKQGAQERNVRLLSDEEPGIPSRGPNYRLKAGAYYANVRPTDDLLPEIDRAIVIEYPLCFATC